MSAKSAAIGLGLAAAVAIGCAGYNETNRRQGEQLKSALQARIDELHAQCEAESERGKQEYANGTDSFRKEKPWLESPLVCDSKDLAGIYTQRRIGVSRFEAALEDLDHALAPGDKGKEDVQTALGRLQNELQRAQQDEPIFWPYGISIALILVTVILPWFWHFFLRRVRELSDAIRGQ